MRLLAAVTALPVATAGVATGQWLYAVYVVAVLYALFGWRPSWLAVPLPPAARQVPADGGRRLRIARAWRSALTAAAVLLLFVVGDAYVGVIARGAGLRDAALLTVAAFMIVVAALLAHRRVEEFERG